MLLMEGGEFIGRVRQSSVIDCKEAQVKDLLIQ